MVAPLAHSSLCRSATTADDHAAYLLPHMVTRRRRLPQLAAIDAMLSNIFILLCIYKLSPLIATGSASDWLWATSAAIVAAASAASTGAHARDEAQRPQANVEMQKAPTTIGVQPDDSAYVKPLLATPPVDGTFTPTAPGAWPDDDAQALAQPSLATPLVDGVHEPATHSRAVQQKTPDAQPFGARRAPPIYLDVTRMPLAELERITDPTPDPPATRIAPPAFVNPDNAEHEFNRRMTAHFERTDRAPRAAPTGGVAAALATMVGGTLTCERHRRRRHRGRRGGRRTRRVAAASDARHGVVAMLAGVPTADAGGETADFLALLAIGDEDLEAEAADAGVCATAGGTSATAAADDDEDAAMLHYAAELDAAGHPGMQLMLELMPNTITANEFYLYFIDYIDPEDQQRIIAGELPDHADVEAIDPELGWHEALGAAVILQMAPENVYSLSDMLGSVPAGASTTAFARMFVDMPPDAQESLVDSNTGNEHA